MPALQSTVLSLPTDFRFDDNISNLYIFRQTSLGRLKGLADVGNLTTDPRKLKRI